MANEIELKVMLDVKNIPILTVLLEKFFRIQWVKKQLANTYYDSDDQFFARQKMGLRVRTQDRQHELTLKTAGNIVGGLHIRPEYNFPLKDKEPDFKGLVSHFNLQLDPNVVLQPLFSTDFERQSGLIHYQDSEIEIALDQGWIINQYGKEAICEFEFELKQGNLTDLLNFIEQLPQSDGMWFSSLSKAQRGYLVGNREEITKNMRKLTACNASELPLLEQYQWEQEIADFIRITADQELLDHYLRFDPHSACRTTDDFYSKKYLQRNLTLLRSLFLN